MNQAPQAHVPVLCERCVQLLGPALQGPDSVLLDCTLGQGGHSAALLERFAGLHVIGLDRDPVALELSRQRLAPFADRVRLVHAVFDELSAVLDDLNHPLVSSVLLDLGVSSMQLDEPDRGFAYSRDAPLDMRMDSQTADSTTAAVILATYSQPELVRVLRSYGQERFAPAIARAIIRRRATAPLQRSSELVELVRQAIPAAARRTGGNPAKRTFQALRIEVNDELGALQRVLPQAIDRLSVGGRIVVLSYHSLEDAAVKRALREASTSTTPPGFPVELAEHAPQLRLLVRGAEKADEAEILRNARATSVRLRAAERVRPARQATPRTTRLRSGSPGRGRGHHGSAHKPLNSDTSGPTQAFRLNPSQLSHDDSFCPATSFNTKNDSARHAGAGYAVTRHSPCTMTDTEFPRSAP